MECKINNDSCYYIIGVVFIRKREECAEIFNCNNVTIRDLEEYVEFYVGDNIVTGELINAYIFSNSDTARTKIKEIINDDLLAKPVYRYEDKKGPISGDSIKNLLIIKISARGSFIIDKYEMIKDSLYVIAGRYADGEIKYVTKVEIEEQLGGDRANINFGGSSKIHDAKIYRSFNEARDDLRAINDGTAIEPYEEVEGLLIELKPGMARSYADVLEREKITEWEDADRPYWIIRFCFSGGIMLFLSEDSTCDYTYITKDKNYYITRDGEYFRFGSESQARDYLNDILLYKDEANYKLAEEAFGKLSRIELLECARTFKSVAGKDVNK